MKARVPLTAEIRKRIEQEVAHRIAEAQKELDEKSEKIRKEEREYTLRRFLKVLCYVLHDKYGFGKKRCLDVIAEYQIFFDENEDTEYLWERLDREVMDRMGLFEGWERDYSNE